jgi:hypothetical protein
MDEWIITKQRIIKGMSSSQSELKYQHLSEWTEKNRDTSQEYPIYGDGIWSRNRPIMKQECQTLDRVIRILSTKLHGVMSQNTRLLTVSSWLIRV